MDQWHHAWTRAAQMGGDTAIINMTAGHGMSTSAAAIVASQTGLEAIVYDDILDKSHRFTPRQLAFSKKLDSSETRVLQALTAKPLSVSALAEGTGLQVSHVSRVLNRLRSKGFTGQEQRGRERVNYLRPGAETAFD